MLRRTTEIVMKNIPNYVIVLLWMIILGFRDVVLVLNVKQFFSSIVQYLQISKKVQVHRLQKKNAMSLSLTHQVKSYFDQLLANNFKYLFSNTLVIDHLSTFKGFNYSL